MAVTALPRFDLAPLSCFLAEASGGPTLKLAACDLLPGGAIQENWGIDAAFSDGPLAGRQRLVLRTDAATGVPSSLPRLDEFVVLKAVFADGVTVPEPLFAQADPALIGKPFFVMRRAARPPPRRPSTPDPQLRPS